MNRRQSVFNLRKSARGFGRPVVSAVLALSILFAGAAAHGYFRYVDENGKLVLSLTIVLSMATISSTSTACSSSA